MKPALGPRRRWHPVIFVPLFLVACDPGVVIFIPPTGSTGSGVSIEVLVLRPDGEPAADAFVQFNRVDTWDHEWRPARTDSAGRATLAPVRIGSLYWVAAEQEDPEWGILGGGEKTFSPQTGSVELLIELSTPRARGVVISEVFMKAPPVWETGLVSYAHGRYVRVANNGEDAVHLDGMLIGKVFSGVMYYPIPDQNRCEDTAVWREDPDGVWSATFWRFPGTGSQHPLAPGETALIAVVAADHRSIHPTIPDLSGADFEFGLPGAGDNPAAPNMISVGPYPPGSVDNDYTSNQYWFIAAPGDPETFPLDRHPGIPPSQPPMWHRRIPAELIHDVIFLWPDFRGSPISDPHPCVHPVHPDFDRLPGGFTAFSDMVNSPQRRRVNVQGRSVLLDTNTSMVDFALATRSVELSP
jgi:hypothetical protein